MGFVPLTLLSLMKISRYCAALASQTTMGADLTDFVTSKRWESSLPHASCSFAVSQSHELLVAPGTGSLFFDQPLLEKIFSQLGRTRYHLLCPIAFGGCLSLHWQVWSDKGADPWVMEFWRLGYRIPFRWTPALSEEPIPYPSYSPTSIRGKALEGEVLSLLEKGAIELAPLPSLGYYSRLFVVKKFSGSWSPVINLSLLGLRVQKTSFKMETL